jgi:hypothetical protein
VASVLFLHNNAKPHKTGAVAHLMGKYGWEKHVHHSHSPDKSPLDFDVFLMLKEPLHGKHFESTENLSTSDLTYMTYHQ